MEHNRERSIVTMGPYDHMGNGKEDSYRMKEKSRRSSWIPIASTIWIVLSIYPVFAFFFGHTAVLPVRMESKPLYGHA